jgi:hypothetical protein
LLQAQFSAVGENARSSPQQFSFVPALPQARFPRRDAANVATELTALLGNDPVLAPADYRPKSSRRR